MSEDIKKLSEEEFTGEEWEEVYVEEGMGKASSERSKYDDFIVLKGVDFS